MFVLGLSTVLRKVFECEFGDCEGLGGGGGMFGIGNGGLELG